MAEAAWKLGFTDLGFSGHTYVDFAGFGIRDELAYAAMLRQLGEQFAGRMRIAVGIEHSIAPRVERFGISAGECLAGCKAGLHDNFRCGDFRTEIGLRPPPEIRNVLLHNHRIVVIFCVL